MSTTKKTAGVPLTSEQVGAYNVQRDQMDNTWSNAQTAYGTWKAPKKKGQQGSWTNNGTEWTKTNRAYTTTVNNLGTQQNQAIAQLRGQLSGRGTATSPMFAGQGVANISNDWQRNYLAATEDKNQRLTAISNLRQQAQAEYNLGLQQLEANKALTRADNKKLMPEAYQ